MAQTSPTELKKILMYIDTMGRGGAQRVMNNLIFYLLGLNVEVVLVNDFKLKGDKPQYSVDGSVKRYYLQDDNSGNAVLKNFRRIKKLRKITKIEKPDIVLSFLGNPNKRMLLATMGLSVRKVVSVRNDPNKEYGSNFISKIVANVLFRLADGIVFQTRDAQKYFTKSTKRKSKIIFNPVSDEFFDTEYIGDEKTIVSIGRLEPQKNNLLLIRAFAEISIKFPEYRLVFYGCGSLQDELQRMCNSLRMDSKVSFAGDTDNVPNVLKHCKVFVLSSDYEGMPNSLMEAMAVGVPCISTNCPCGGPKELIENGKDGILINVGNIEQLCNSLDIFLSNERFRRECGRNSKKRAEVFRSFIVYYQWNTFLLNLLENR